MSNSELKARIQEAMKDAMRAKDQRRLDVIRFLLSTIKKQEIDAQKDLDDADILGVIQKLVKQYAETLALYKSSGRNDLIDQQQFEIDLLSEYLPPQLDEEAVDALIGETIKSLNAASMQEMGKVMAVLKEKLQGQADIGSVSKKVKERLTPTD